MLGVTTIITKHQYKTYLWLEIVKPTATELDQLIPQYQIPEKFKNYMLDRHEQPRSTYDDLADFGVLIIRALAGDADAAEATVPIFIGFNSRVLITVCHGEKQSKLTRRTDQQPDAMMSDHILAVLAAILGPYFDLLDDLSQRAEKYAGRHVGTVTNHKLDVVSTLKTEMVYLRSATAGNLSAIQELQNVLDQKIEMTPDIQKQTKQKITDLVIEYRQCQTMFTVQADVVSETESAFGNVLNNRLNSTMKFLTIWSLVLAIPPIVSGFYGMNVKLPLAGRADAWFDTLVITVILMVAMLLVYVGRKK